MWIMTRKRKEAIPTKGATFGERLRAFRTAQGLTQQDLGDLVGVSKRAVCAYERNNSEPPVHVLVKIASALRVSIDELLGRKPPQTAPAKSMRRRWMRKFQEIDQLPERKQQTIMQVIDMALKSTG